MLVRTLRALQVLGCVVGVLVLFVPWHTVREVDWSSCLAPDCQTTATGKPLKTCAGIEHFESHEVALVIAAIVAALGVVLFSLGQTGWRAIVSGLVGGVGQALLFLWVLVIVSLKHLFSNVTTGAGEYVFVGTGVVLVTTSLIAVIRAIVQSVRARRAG
ncbi:MAG: hypothetical protein GQE15_31065 [Archangiaceae bacterium]|nr:hypothetical protein [Archangiaceae bacterium]